MHRTRVFASPTKTSWSKLCCPVIVCCISLHTVVKAIISWLLGRQTNRKRSCYYTLTWFVENFSDKLGKISLWKCGKPEINEPCVQGINVFVVNIITPCSKALGCGVFYSTVMCCHLPDVATFTLTCWILLRLVNVDLLFKSRAASLCRRTDKAKKSQRM